jgi:hypothetical protein
VVSKNKAAVPPVPSPGEKEAAILARVEIADVKRYMIRACEILRMDSTQLIGDVDKSYEDILAEIDSASLTLSHYLRLRATFNRAIFSGVSGSGLVKLHEDLASEPVPKQFRQKNVVPPIVFDLSDPETAAMWPLPKEAVSGLISKIHELASKYVMFFSCACLFITKNSES